MKYYIIAGEASGDLHGSNLMKALYKEDPSAEIHFWGGDLMQKAGGTLVKHYRDLAFMGFIEVAVNLKTILNNIKICKADIDDKPVIAVLPGSRKQEITKMLDLMLSVVNDFRDYQFVIAGAPSQDYTLYAPFLKNKNVHFVANNTYDLLSISQAALVTSGTATLETALFKVPEVVCYKGSWASYQIAKRIITLKYISLVNL